MICRRALLAQKPQARLDVLGEGLALIHENKGTNKATIRNLNGYPHVRTFHSDIGRGERGEGGP